MASASKHQNPYSSSKPPKPPNPNTHTDTTNSPIITLTPSQEHLFLTRATHLTRQELLRRRSHYLKQLCKCYRVHFWALMDQLKIQFRQYCWDYGLSPFLNEQQQQHTAEFDGERDTQFANLEGNEVNISSSSSYQRCAFVGCKLKSMPLTSFCHLHILSDSKQKLYKPCHYVIKSAQAGPITCGKPIMRSTVPSLCSIHFQKAQKNVTRALKKAGLNASTSSKLASNFHVIVAEYVRQIQAKRRTAKRANRSKVVVKEEIAG
ncbi:hypothetical protein ACB092_04G052600 [Castanea dentata]